MMKKNILLLIGLLVAFFAVQAQIIDSISNESNEEKVLQNYVYFSPLYLIVEGTRLDYEHRLKNNASAFNVGVTFFVGDMNSDLTSDSWGDEDYLGIKTDFLHKIYLAETTPIRGQNTAQAYFAHGPFYQYSNIQYEEQTQEWQEVNSNGLMVLNLVDVNVKNDIHIHRFGYSAILGVQVVTESRLTFDIYTGLSLRKAWTNTDDDSRLYDNTWISPGHTGNVLLLGFKIGAGF